MTDLLPLLLQGTWITVQITVFGCALALLLALLAALGRLSKLAPLRWLCISYIELFRGTSLLVQLFWLFFVLPLPPFNLNLSAYSVAVLGLGLHFGAYGAEVLRGAIGSVDVGQWEAATALNMSKAKRFWRIILPQSLICAIPPGTNLCIELLKNTSLVSLITLSDLSFRARQLDQATFMTLEIFALTLLLYFVLAQLLAFLMRTLERHFTHGHSRGVL